MSSLARRMEIRGLKAMGFKRRKYRAVRWPDGRVEHRRVPRAGMIEDPLGRPIGYRWPRLTGA